MFLNRVIDFERFGVETVGYEESIKYREMYRVNKMRILGFKLGVVGVL